MATLDDSPLLYPGQSWSTWAEKLQNKHKNGSSVSSENNARHDESDSMKLKKEDMSLYGLCPAQDELYLVVCEKCGLLVKPQALRHHIELRHSSANSVKVQQSSSDTDTQLAESPVALSTCSTNSNKSMLSSTPSKSRPRQHKHGGERRSKMKKSETFPVVKVEQIKDEPVNDYDERLSSPPKLSPSKPSTHELTLSHHASKSSSRHRKNASPGASKRHSHNKRRAESLQTAKSAPTHNQFSDISSDDLNTSAHNNSDIVLPSVFETGTTTVSTLKARRSPSPVAPSSPDPFNSSTLSNNGSLDQTYAYGLPNTSLMSTALSPVPSPICSPVLSPVSSPMASPVTSPVTPPASMFGIASPKVANRKLTKGERRERQRNVSASKSPNAMPPPPFKMEKNIPCKDRQFDANKHCGVTLPDTGKQCTRSLTCKTHALSLRRKVEGRCKSFDDLLEEHRAKKEAILQYKQLHDPNSVKKKSSSEQHGKSKQNHIGTTSSHFTISSPPNRSTLGSPQIHTDGDVIKIPLNAATGSPSLRSPLHLAMSPGAFPLLPGAVPVSPGAVPTSPIYSPLSPIVYSVTRGQRAEPIPVFPKETTPIPETYSSHLSSDESDSDDVGQETQCLPYQPRPAAVNTFGARSSGVSGCNLFNRRSDYLRIAFNSAAQNYAKSPKKRTTLDNDLQSPPPRPASESFTFNVPGATDPIFLGNSRKVTAIRATAVAGNKSRLSRTGSNASTESNACVTNCVDAKSPTIRSPISHYVPKRRRKSTAGSTQSPRSGSDTGPIVQDNYTSVDNLSANEMPSPMSHDNHQHNYWNNVLMPGSTAMGTINATTPPSSDNETSVIYNFNEHSETADSKVDHRGTPVNMLNGRGSVYDTDFNDHDLDLESSKHQIKNRYRRNNVATHPPTHPPGHTPANEFGQSIVIDTGQGAPRVNGVFSVNHIVLENPAGQGAVKTNRIHKHNSPSYTNNTSQKSPKKRGRTSSVTSSPLRSPGSTFTLKQGRLLSPTGGVTNAVYSTGGQGGYSAIQIQPKGVSNNSTHHQKVNSKGGLSLHPISIIPMVTTPTRVGSTKQRTLLLQSDDR